MSQPNHPWNPLPQEPKGDPDDDSTFAAVGRALTTWEALESDLARTFAMLCDARFEGAARAYGALGSFSSRRDMLDAAFDCYPHRGMPAITHFPKLLEEIRQFGARRNEIAHGTVVILLDLGCYLVPAEYNSRKHTPNELADAPGWPTYVRRGQHKYAYTAQQILYYEGEFQRLIHAVVAVQTAILFKHHELLRR